MRTRDCVVERSVAGQAVGQYAQVAAALAVGVQAHVGQPFGWPGVEGQVGQAAWTTCLPCSRRGRHRAVDDQRALGVDQQFGGRF